MALGDLPNDDIADYFLRSSVFLSDSNVIVDVKIGKIEIEITEYIIKKVAETLIQDFPQSNRYWVDQAGSSSNPKEKINLEVKLRLEEIMTKIRVKKEISSAKVVGLYLKLGLSDTMNLWATLDDFQILHQNNELIVKHNSFNNQSIGVEDDLDTSLLSIRVT